MNPVKAILHLGVLSAVLVVIGGMLGASRSAPGATLIVSVTE